MKKMKKILSMIIAAVLFILAFTASGCASGIKNEAPASEQISVPAEAAPVEHWMAAEPGDKYPYVIFLEKNGTGMTCGTSIGWKLER